MGRAQAPLYAAQRGLRLAKIEVQRTGLGVRDTHAHAVWGRRVFGAQQITVYPIEEIDTLVLSAHIHVVAEETIGEKLHAHTRGKVE